MRKARHGTTTMYRYGCRCEACKAAKAKDKAGYAERKKDGDFEPRQRIKPRIEICVPIVLCMSRDFDISQKDIGEAIGCSRGVVALRLAEAGYKRGRCSNNKRTGQASHDRAFDAFTQRIADEYGGQLDVVEHSRHRTTFRCNVCGEVFTRTTVDRYRCPACERREREQAANDRRDAMEREKRERMEKQLAVVQVCERCGAEFRAETARRYCSDECRDRAWYARNHPKEVRICPTCGEPFEAYSGRHVYCSRKCFRRSPEYRNSKKQYKTGNHRKRARRYDVEYEPGITLRKVYAKDNGICYLCGCKTDKTDIVQSGDGYACGPTYPTIDHVIPLSRGGGHTWENVRLACRDCNSRKGDRLDG